MEVEEVEGWRRLKDDLAIFASALDFPTTVHVDGKFGDQEVFIKEMYRKVVE